MSNRIQSDSSNTSLGMTQDGASRDSQDTEQGVYRGEQVVKLPSQASLLEDAFEELTDIISEDEEKDFSKREVEEGKLSDTLERALTLKGMEEILDSLTDLRQGELERVLRQLLHMRDAHSRELRERARQEFKDPSHQYAALKALVNTLRESGAPAARIEAAEGALQQLMDEEGAAVRAGINITKIADGFADAQLGNVQGLRESYRDAVLDYQNISAAYASLVEKYGAAELPKAIKFLIKALGADMSALGASISKTKLNAILDDMYRLEVLTGLLEKCDKLVEQSRESGAASGLRGSDLLKEVLDLQQNKWLRPEQISPLPTKFGITDIEQEIVFLSKFKELTRLIPLKAYTEQEQRQRLLDAIQLALDDAVEREEE